MEPVAILKPRGGILEGGTAPEAPAASWVGGVASELGPATGCEDVSMVEVTFAVVAVVFDDSSCSKGLEKIDCLRAGEPLDAVREREVDVLLDVGVTDSCAPPRKGSQ